MLGRTAQPTTLQPYNPTTLQPYNPTTRRLRSKCAPGNLFFCSKIQMDGVAIDIVF